RLELGGERRPEAEVCKAHWRVLLGTDGRTRVRRRRPRRSALRSRRAVRQTRRMEADRAVVLIGLPPSVADSYRLRVASTWRCVNSPRLDDRSSRGSPARAA